MYCQGLINAFEQTPTQAPPLLQGYCVVFLGSHFRECQQRNLP